MPFDGETYDRELDRDRLTTQLDRVRDTMSSGAWRTLAELAQIAGGSEASVSARLRDLRKPKFGAWTIERKRTDGGLHYYRAKQYETGTQVQMFPVDKVPR